MLDTKAANVNIEEFSNLLPFYKEAMYPILIRGPHGIGKSAIVEQLATQYEMPIVQRRASQMTEGDLCGLPKIHDGATLFCPLKWFKVACDEPVVLFLDELDRASKEVRQGFFELADSRTIFGQTLHPQTLVFAAINGGGQSNFRYQVSQFDPAELDRWVVFDLVPEIAPWLNWAERKNDKGQENIIPIMRAYLEGNGKGVWRHTGKDFDPDLVIPSPRSWHRLSNVLATSGLVEQRKRHELTQISASIVGPEAGKAFTEFVISTTLELTAEDIIANKMEFVNNAMKTFTSRQTLKCIETFNSWKRLYGKFKKSELKRIWNFVDQLDAEFYMKFYEVVAEESAKNSNGKVSTLWEQLTLHTEEACVSKLYRFMSIDTLDNQNSLVLSCGNVLSDEEKAKMEAKKKEYYAAKQKKAKGN